MLFTVTVHGYCWSQYKKLYCDTLFPLHLQYNYCNTIFLQYTLNLLLQYNPLGQISVTDSQYTFCIVTQHLPEAMPPSSLQYNSCIAIQFFFNSHSSPSHLQYTDCIAIQSPFFLQYSSHCNTNHPTTPFKLQYNWNLAI